MADEVPDLSPAEVAAAQAEFLANPPEILDPNEPAPAPSAEADEAAALAELTKTPAAQEGVSQPGTVQPGAPAPAPAQTGTPGVPAGADPFAVFGGYESVRTAMAVQEALRTEQGVRALVAQGLTELGYDVNQVRAALEAAEAGPTATTATDPFAGLEDDDVVTVAQTKALLQQLIEQNAQQFQQQTEQRIAPLAEVIQQQQATAVRTVTDNTVMELLGLPPYDDPEKLATYQRQVDAIVERGARYYDQNQWGNPAHIRNAVVQANAEINAEQESRFQDYLAHRRAVRDSQPVNIGGGAGSEGPLPEPKNLDDARKQLQAQGFFS